MSKDTTGRHRARRWRLGVTLLLATILAIAILIRVSDTARFAIYSFGDFCLYGFPTERDQADAEAVRSIILLAHPFPKDSVSQPGRPPVFRIVGSTRLLTNPTSFRIYEVQDLEEQDKIIAAAQGVVTARQARPIELRFYDHENWKVNDNVALRGPEKLLRRVKIESK